MKILMVFIDMLRPNLTNVFCESNEVTAFDDAISRLGGTLFTSCFTPAPDTPRSLASMWSSAYPSENGCNSRLKYPKFYLQKKSFLECLIENGYRINVLSNPNQISIGEFPLDDESLAIYNNKSITDFLNAIDLSCNSLSFMGFEDFHYVINDVCARSKYINKAYDLSGYIINEIINHPNFISFDLLIVFSDHGFKISNENFDTNLKMLDKPRTQTFMFLHQKTDRFLVKNNKLSSIMDIFPTILDYCNIRYDVTSIEGISLFDKKEHDFILIEDYKNFSVSTGASIDRWGFRTASGLSVVDSSLRWQTTDDNFDTYKDFFLSFLKMHASDFSENIKIQSINDRYKTLFVKNDYYIDGTKRVIRLPLNARIESSIRKFITLVKKIIS